LVKAQRPATVHGPYRLSIRAVAPDQRRRDIDNLIKPANDLLQFVGVIDDDCECRSVTAEWVSDGAAFLVHLESA
jgi:Holliday junction resolvase RusA-like endonuclease